MDERSRGEPSHHEPVGGDPVCWAHLLCPSCGAMPDTQDPSSGTCPRCGEELAS